VDSLTASKPCALRSREATDSVARPLSYRSDLDGLRAVAVTMVIAYHLAPGALPGGFTGVDVFFVISGYLISYLILAGIERGSFTIAEFYSRRVRRILPALLIVLACCLLIGWFTLMPNEFRWFGKSITWCAPFLANIFFAHVTGYFDPGADYNLLLHLWSLGVEEQFYLLWPILLFVAVRYRLTTPILCAVIAISFAFSLWGARHAPVKYFFMPGPRVWELALGALLAVRQMHALAAPRRKLQDVSRQYLARLLSISGIAFILAGALLLNADTALSGVGSVMPVTGALLLIGAGPQAVVNRSLLGSALLVFIGRISYSLYLWHWPLFAFARELWGPELPNTALAAIAALTFVAAYASYRWVELPLRRGAGSRWAVSALLVGLLGFAALGNAVSQGRLAGRLSGPAFTAWEAAVTDWKIPNESSIDKAAPFSVPSLHTAHTATTLFIGDSHMQQYWPRITEVLKTHAGTARSVLFAAYAGCPILPALNSLRQPRRCDTFFTNATQLALQPQIDTVVFGAFWELYLLGEYAQDDHQGVYRSGDPLRTRLRLGSPETQRALQDFERLIARLTASGRRVFIILSNPTSPAFDPRWLVPWQVRLSPSMPAVFALKQPRAIDATGFEDFVAPLMSQLRGIAARGGARVLDPRTTLCEGIRCPAVAVDGTPLYIDSNHLRATYARERASFLDESLLDWDSLNDQESLRPAW
jgi:peptidoglycan/LPS O-acetylase OafA/YrhL